MWWWVKIYSKPENQKTEIPEDKLINSNQKKNRAESNIRLFGPLLSKSQYFEHLSAQEEGLQNMG